MEFPLNAKSAAGTDQRKRFTSRSPSATGLMFIVGTHGLVFPSGRMAAENEIHGPAVGRSRG
jgi:hypothetical protein